MFRAVRPKCLTRKSLNWWWPGAESNRVCKRMISVRYSNHQKCSDPQSDPQFVALDFGRRFGSEIGQIQSTIRSSGCESQHRNHCTLAPAEVALFGLIDSSLQRLPQECSVVRLIWHVADKRHATRCLLNCFQSLSHASLRLDSQHRPKFPTQRARRHAPNRNPARGAAPHARRTADSHFERTSYCARVSKRIRAAPRICAYRSRSRQHDSRRI